LALLTALAKAHAVPVGPSGQREPILYISLMGGPVLRHPHLTDTPRFDDAMLDELAVAGLLSFDYTGSGSKNITPTSLGHRTVETYERSKAEDPVADTEPLFDAIRAQAAAENKLAWPAVRPVLVALRDYWMAGGLSRHGIQMRALTVACPDENKNLLTATVRSLVEGGYLEPTSSIELASIPAELRLTDRARSVLDGWPGAAPSDLAENLLAVLVDQANKERDPVRKRRLEKLVDTVKELGISLTSEVLAKVITGGK